MKITEHAKQRAREKGFSPADVGRATHDPDVIYPSRNYPGQERRIRDGLCVIVDGDTVVTVFEHCVVTPLRPDQTTNPTA